MDNTWKKLNNLITLIYVKYEKYVLHEKYERKKKIKIRYEQESKLVQISIKKKLLY